MFVAREGFKEMLEVDDAASRTIPILSKLIVPLRAALVRSDSCCLFLYALLSKIKKVISHAGLMHGIYIEVIVCCLNCLTVFRLHQMHKFFTVH